MVININTDRRLFFRQALEVIRGLPPLDALRTGELDVLGEFMYFNHKFSHIEENLRGRLLFDYDTKQNIADNLGIKSSNLDNIITSLRKKNIITRRAAINTYGIKLDSPDILFKFNIKEDE
jgi:DNA-binding MarR family transcriptional regulator